MKFIKTQSENASVGVIIATDREQQLAPKCHARVVLEKK